MGCIDDLVDDPRKLLRMGQVVTDSIANFERFCIEVTGTETDHELNPSRDVARRVSAA